MQIGFAKREITPPLLQDGDDSISILGWWWARAQTYREIHDPLYARAMAVREGNDAAVVMSCDLFGDIVGFTARAAERIAQQHGLKPERVFIACTHTHTSPDTLNIGRAHAVADWWIDELVEKLAETAGTALGAAREGTLWWAEAALSGLVENRRAHLVAAYEKRHRPLSPELRQRAAAADETLRVLWATDPAGKPFGALANFACHPVIMQTLPMISADYCGPAAARVEEAFGEGFVSLYVNGPCGDINPVCLWSYEYSDCEKTGGAIAAATEAAIRGGGAPVLAAPIAGALGAVEVQRQDIDKSAARTRRKLLQKASDQATAAGKSVKDGDHPLCELVRTKEILRVAEMPASAEVAVHALRLGDVVFVCFPGEFFTALGQDVRSAVGGHVVLAACTRGHTGYICPREAFTLGGYEIGPGTWSWLKEGCGERIAEKGIELAKSLK